MLSLASNLAVGLLHPSAGFWDEPVYNHAAQLLLQGKDCPTISLTVGSYTAPLATACNYEHPPLVKALVAATLYLLGPLSGAGFAGTVASFLSLRVVQLTTGALSLPLMYSVAYDISRDRRLALIAAVLLFLDPLYAFFSRVDYLDVPAVFFALCAYAVYFGGRRLGQVNEYAASGLFLALSLLCKETAVVFVLPLVVYHFLFRQASWGRKSAEALTILGVEALVSASGLQLYDSLARTPFPTFVSQLQYMVGYSTFLACPNLCNSPGSGPWYFFLTPGYWTVLLSYNLVLLWLVLLWVPVGVLLTWRALRKNRTGSEDRLFVFSSLLFASTFLENEFIYYGGRIVWMWYYLMVVPSLALGGAYLLTRPGIPRWLRAALGLSLVGGYLLAYYIGPGLLMYD
ncbi:MAG: phospholipid carrier-dependent glycosyltransferase [Nitrososphaerota archaeon]|nr:phospholipid carrier-dependent glycosyltransferase [Nitrososphaerota archaeon]